MSTPSMLHFAFEPIDAPQDFGPLDRGHLEVRGRAGTCTSRNRTPDQSMMLLLSVTALLDGARRFLQGRAKRGRLGTVDASFQLVLERRPEGRVALLCDGRELDVVSRQELVQALWHGVQRLQACLPGLDGQEAAVSDLHQATAAFAAAFNLA